PPIIVYTPYGAIEAKPEFGLASGLKAVVSPYGSSSSKLQSDGDQLCPQVSLMQDVYGRAQGQAATVLGGGPVVVEGDPLRGSGLGWDSQMALGGRDAAGDSPWTLVSDPTSTAYLARPDLDQTQTRSDTEKKLVSEVSAGMRIEYSPT